MNAWLSSIEGMAIASLMTALVGCAVPAEWDDGVSPEDARSASRALAVGYDTLSSSPNVEMGIPIDGDDSDDYLMDKQQYVLSYNPTKLVPNWVSWTLNRSHLGAASRTNSFRADTSLPSNMVRVQPKDYSSSGYDRGHMCPSADRTTSQSANATTFIMTNMQPQKGALNSGPWAQLEECARDLARDSDQEVFIVAGGVFTPKDKLIGKGIAVPSANFKILVSLRHGQGLSDVTTDTSVIAVIMPNDASASGTKWTKHLVSIDRIEEATGYDFLSQVPEDTQRVLESKIATGCTPSSQATGQ